MLAPLLLAAPLAITTDTVGADVEFPVVDTSSAVTLTIAESMYTGPGVQQRTRLYNGDIVGPTIRVQPGSTFTITLQNHLTAPGFSTASLHNQFKTFDVTNLHTHAHDGSNQSHSSPASAAHVAYCCWPAAADGCSFLAAPNS